MPKKHTFNSKTGQAYKDMRARARTAAKDETGELPFTMAEFRQWAWEQASYPGESRATREKGARMTIHEGIRWLCPYTKEEFLVDQFAADHKIPRSRGGPDTLENLIVCRSLANKAKGALAIWEFQALMKVMLLWDRATREMALRQWAAGTSAQAKLMRMGAALRRRKAR